MAFKDLIKLAGSSLAYHAGDVVDHALGPSVGAVATLLTNRSNREFAMAQAQLQNKWNIEQWERENAYNSPAAQMQRYIDAGLNPNLVLGMQNLSASSPQMVSAKDAPAAVPPVDALTAAQVRNLDAQTRKLNEESKLPDAEIRELLARENLHNVTAEELKSDIAYNQKSVEKMTEEIEVLRQDQRGRELQNDFLARTFDDRVNQVAADSHISQERAASIVEVIDATIRQLNGSAAASEAQARLSGSQIKVQNALVGYYNALSSKADEEAALVRLEREIKDAYGDELAAAEITHYLTVTESTSTSVSNSTSENGSFDVKGGPQGVGAATSHGESKQSSSSSSQSRSRVQQIPSDLRNRRQKKN